MNEKITMKIDSEELIKILESYYRQINNNPNITVEIKTGIKCVGIYEDKEADVKIILKSKMKVGNYESEITEELTEENVKEAVKNELNNSDLQIESLRYNKGIRYADRPWDSTGAYFKGIIINLKRKQLQRTL